jgi:phage gp37-like protein
MNLGRIEQGIKDALAALQRPYIAEIRTYGGEFDSELAQVVKRFPAIWVTFGGAGSPDSQRASGFRMPLTWVVLVAAKSLRTEETARHGAVDGSGQVLSVGTFELLRDVAVALTRNDLGLPIEALRPGRVRTIFNTQTNGEAVSVLSWEWHTHAWLAVPDRDAGADHWLERVNVDYVAKPGDDTPEASDAINVGSGS